MAVKYDSAWTVSRFNSWLFLPLSAILRLIAFVRYVPRIRNIQPHRCIWSVSIGYATESPIELRSQRNQEFEP